MPQMTKGRKFIFGKSLIRWDMTVHLPTQAVTEYNIVTEGKVYLFTGSKDTGDSVSQEKNYYNYPNWDIFLLTPLIY